MASSARARGGFIYYYIYKCNIVFAPPFRKCNYILDYGHKTTHVLCERTALVRRTQDNPDAPGAREGATCDECDANCTVTEETV
eukprot:scaffold92825_cov66-Phaeocystis_antarctica.AAC.2